MRPEPSYRPGERIGGQYLVHQAMVGGMGEVFLCYDEQGKRPYALKTFQRRYNILGLKEAFFEEIGHWIKLEKHPNIVRCHYMETVDNRPFAFLEWVANDDTRGTSLRDWLRRGKLENKTALSFVIDILRGLKHAGEKSPGIVHRDLKPENVLIGQNRIAKISDFGLAAIGARAELVAEESNEDEIWSGTSLKGGIAGTPLYMAPEQWQGTANFDARTDIYAVGCILYELLTGRFLYPETTINALRSAHCNALLPDMSEIGWASPFLNHCLAKIPSERFVSVGEALAEIETLYEIFIRERPTEAPNPAALEAFELSDLGTTLANLQRLEEALAVHNEAIRLAPTLAEGYSNRGTTWLALERPEEALADFTKALDLNPNLTLTYSNRGLALRALERLEEALIDHNNAVILNPTLSFVYFNRGQTLNALGRVEEALADYEMTIHLDPGYAIAYFMIGTLYANARQYEKSLVYFKRAADLGYEDAPQVIDSMLQIVAQTAFEAFRRANSFLEMRDIVSQHTILYTPQIIAGIELAIQQQVPPHLRPEFIQRLTWLKQIVMVR